MKSNFLTLFLLVYFLNAYSQIYTPLKEDLKRERWVDSIMNTLSVEEKIAQLIIIRSNSDNPTSAIYDTITRQITSLGIGGVCFFKGSPTSQVEITKKYQKSSKIPLFIAIDGEWGVGMRLDSTPLLPRQMTMGALTDDSLIYYCGREMGKQCKLLGININFSPVADINSNPNNPVINSRSFGEDKYLVAKKSILLMKGMQDEGIITTAKHFPGHGDTDSDSHYTLPVVNHSKDKIDTLDLYPFKALINAGISGVMVAHLFIPAFDTSYNTASSLSPVIVEDLLVKKLGFNGLVFTDALEMKGVTNYFKPGIIELKAVMAGNDVLLLPENPSLAIKTIKQAIDSNIIDISVIDSKCRKILSYKYQIGFDSYKDFINNNYVDLLNNNQTKILNYKILKNSITLIKNDNDLLPITGTEKLNIGVISLGETSKTVFQDILDYYGNFKYYSLVKDFTLKERDSLIKMIKQHDLLIVSLHNTSSLPSKNYGISSQIISLIDTLSSIKKVVLNVFGYPYIMNVFNGRANPASILISNQDRVESQWASAQVIFGASQSQGFLPVSISDRFPLKKSINIEKIRLGFALPEEKGIDSENLSLIDSIALMGIKEEAYPGCQILIAKDSDVIYYKSFGNVSYTDTTSVNNKMVYDLASITKVASTTLAIMKLYENNKLELDDKLSKYLKYLRKSNKRNITIRQVMSHQARLKPWIPFYKEVIKNGIIDSNYFRKSYSNIFSLKVADSLYVHKDYKNIIIQSIVNSELNDKETYEYSDLGFYLLKELVEKITNQPFDKYLNEQFYKKLGLKSTGFNPLEIMSKKTIVPTENDTIFRKQLIHGYVHDQGAAILGGVSGHAGLFSNAYELAVIFQMLLQNGEYGGYKFFKPSTISEFTHQQFPNNNNRRALGFDRQLATPNSNAHVCPSASQRSYGHTGFTGTIVWADPDYNLIYIFLSNRVNPSANNNKLSKLNIRTQIQQVIYNSLSKN